MIDLDPLYTIIVLFSALSFLIYGVLCLTSSRMKENFKRFELEKYSTPIGVLEILGGAGLVIGMFYRPIMLISLGGLAVLMLLGVFFRIRSGDRFIIVVPAMFYLVLTSYLFVVFVRN